MATKIKIRRDTKENWENVNPILADGEIALITNTGHIKVGNGVDSFRDINAGRFVECMLDARKSDEVWGKEIEFNEGIYIITTRCYANTKDINHRCYDADGNEILFSLVANHGREDNVRWSGKEDAYRLFSFTYYSRFTLILDALSGVAQGSQDFIYSDGKRYISHRSYVSPVEIKKIRFWDNNTDGSNDITPLRLRIIRLY